MRKQPWSPRKPSPAPDSATGDERVDAALEDLPPEARNAYHSRGEWEYTPDSAEGADEWAGSYHGDWYKYRLVRGWRVERGHLFETLWNVDTGGWSFSTEKDVSVVGYQAWQEFHSYEASRKSWCKYYEHVVAINKDPLGVFITLIPVPHPRFWEFVVKQSEVGGVILEKARLGKRGEWLPPDQLPKYVSNWFMLTNVGGTRWYISPGSWKTLDALTREATDDIEWKKVGLLEATGIAEILELVAPAFDVVRAARKAIEEECLS